MTDRLDLHDRYRRQLEALLAEHVPDAEAWAYGSRVNGRSHPASDLDLVLRGPGLERIPASQLAELEEAIEQSNIPILIQTHDWARLPASFHKEIKKQYVILHEPSSPKTPKRSRGITRGQACAADATTRTLGDVAEITMGQSPPGSTVAASGEAPLLNGPTEFGPSHPVPTQFTSDGRKFASPGDILFCVRGSTTGRMNWADQPYAIGRGVASIRHRSEPSLQHLVRAVIEHELPKLLAQATGSTFPNVSAQHLAAIAWPNIEPQELRAISRVLGALDDKIELNRRMSMTLEEIAHALFKSWFVDFDPVHAKAEGRPSGLPPDFDALFPASFQPSELGQIPEGWQIARLDDLAVFLNGLALQKYPPTTRGSLPIIKIAQLRSGHLRNADLASDELDTQYIVEDGDILFSWSGSLECRLWTGGIGALNQHLFKVIPNNIPKWLCYFAIHNHLTNFRSIAAGKATTMGHIQRHHLSDAMQALPAQDLLAHVDGVIGPAVERLVASGIETGRLAVQRDTLLPALISGKQQIMPRGRLATSA